MHCRGVNFIPFATPCCGREKLLTHPSPMADEPRADFGGRKRKGEPTPCVTV